MKIFTIVGTRPNFIKVDTELKQTIVHTGQHFDYRMSQAFFEELRIPKPEYNLNCKNKPGKMIDKLLFLFRKEKPDLVLVFGDTNSSLAGALAASYAKIPVAHVEAGLRSHRLSMPEEVNRVLIDRIARVRFCPNENSALNLLKEGIKDDIHIVGDPMFDTMGKFLPFPKNDEYKKYIFITLHRDFNADNKFTLQSFFAVLSQFPDEKFIFPIHPRTEKNLKKFKIAVPKNVEIRKPATYKETLTLISNAKKVITDSGGVQREAFWMSVPVIIPREETEWIEIIAKKAGVLVGDDVDKLKDAITNFKGTLNAPPVGGANKKIREILYKYL